jgi:hypothetical protein
MITRVTGRQLWYGIAAGLLMILGWYAATRTTLLLAYGHGGNLTLHEVQGQVASAIGQIAAACQCKRRRIAAASTATPRG